MKDLLDNLNQFIVNTTGGQAAADARRREAIEQQAKIKDAEGVNVKQNDDGTLAETIGDKINSFLGSIGGSSPKLDDVQSEYSGIQTKRKSKELIEANPTIDYEGIDRSDYEAVRAHTQLQNDIRKAQADGIDTTGITTSSGLKDRRIDTEIADSNKKTESSVDFIRQGEQFDDNYNLNVTQLINAAQSDKNRNAIDLAALKATVEQAKLDRAYQAEKDMRDYEYRIKKDDQEQLDKIFALILGGVDKMF